MEMVSDTYTYIHSLCWAEVLHFASCLTSVDPYFVVILYLQTMRASSLLVLA